MRIQLPSPERSEFIRSLRMLASHEGVPLHLAGTLRALKDDEREQLVSQANHAADWTQVRVADGFAPELVVGNHFIGACVLGITRKNAERSAGPASDSGSGAIRNVDASQRLPVGIYHSTLLASIIGDECRVYRCPLVSHTTVDRAVTLIDCTVEGPGGDAAAAPDAGVGAFGIGTSITVGNETGGRTVPLFADIDLALATELAEAGTAATAAALQRYMADRVRETRLGRSYIGPSASVSGSTLRSVWIGPWAVIGPATDITAATILSSRDEPTVVGTDAHVEQSLIQWGAGVRSGALISRSVLMEHGECERRALVTSAVIGPNTHIAEGEVTSSLVGPFVALHHQSLLIAAVWPQGRGNISQGANVGSNHTGRAPDQEIHPGEGSFFGLDCAIKFPCNLARAPYSIVATSTILPPQRIEMPFSLIAAPTEGTGDHTVLVPAWLLRHSLYTLARNDQKYRTRNKARRNAVESPVMREDIAVLMDAARRALEQAEPVDDLYAWRGPREVDGIGVCVIREKDRRAAISAYRDGADLIRLGDRLDSGGADSLSADERARYADLVRAWRDNVRSSRERDQVRGRLVFDDYDAVHADLSADRTIAAVDGWAIERLAAIGAS